VGNLKGARVRISANFRMPDSWGRVGTVIAESEECVGVKLDGFSVPLIVTKRNIAVVLT
jgi:hypothetical protein